VSLIARIEDELKTAMRERETVRRDALRLILTSLRDAEKELQRPLHDQEELQVLQRNRKRHLEAAEAYRAGGNEERARGEEAELLVGRIDLPELRTRFRGRHALIVVRGTSYRRDLETLRAYALEKLEESGELEQITNKWMGAAAGAPELR
jgi:uncharacterized membrane-anchored protein